MQTDLFFCMNWFVILLMRLACFVGHILRKREVHILCLHKF